MATWETISKSSSSGWETVGTKKDDEWETITAPSPTVEEVNRTAIAAIGEAIPDSVKNVASKIGNFVKDSYESLPEPVQKAGKTTGNFLLDTIDILQRPFQASAVTVKNLFNAEAEAEAKRTGNPFVFLSDENTRRALKAGERGLLGQEKASTQELLSDDFRRNNPVKSALIGFAGDVLADPLKAEVVAGTVNAIKNTAKTVSGSVSVPGRLADNELFRAFNINTGDVQKAQDLFNKYRFLRDKATMESVTNAKAFDNEIAALARETGYDTNVLKAKIVQDIETAKLSDGTIGELEAKIIERNRALLEEQKAAGIDIGDLGETYMPHILTKEADDLLKGGSNFFGIRPSAKTPQALTREIEGTVAEINAKNLSGTSKFFLDDPAVMLGVAEYRAANALAGKKFLNDAVELGVRAENAPASYVTVPEIPGMKFAPEVARRLNRSYRALTNDAEMSKVLKVLDGATNWWKMWSLGARPAYHSKNVVGNVWNAYLGGLENPVRFGEAAAFQVKLGKNKLDGEMLGRPVNELYEAMATRGVIGEGQYGGDIARNIESQLQPGLIRSTAREIRAGKSFAEIQQTVTDELGKLTLPRVASVVAGTENPILKTGYAVGTVLEDNARIALFFDQLKKGKNYDEAAAHVQKYLFDYGDLAPFERDVLKRAMPFYTWSRKNIPLQLEAIVTHPDKVNKINLFKENMQSQVQVPDQDEVPEYLKEGMPIFLPNASQDGFSAVALQNLLPFSDLQVFTKYLNTSSLPDSVEQGKLSKGASTAMSGVNPILKAPIEYLTNYDFFRRQNIEKFPDESADMLGVKMPVHLAKLLSNIVLISELDRTNPGGIFGTRERNLQTGEITTTPSIFGESREARVDLPEEQRQAQYFTGIRIYDLMAADIESQKMGKIRQDLAALDKYIQRANRAEKPRGFDEAVAARDKYIEMLDEIEARAEKRKKREK